MNGKPISFACTAGIVRTLNNPGLDWFRLNPPLVFLD